MEKSTKVFFVLIILAFLVCLWFLSIACYKVWNYTRLDTRAKVEEVSWKIRQLSSEKFILEGTYTYRISGVEYKGVTLFKKNVYLNQFSAEYGLKNTALKKNWLVWFNSKNPAFSSLEKHFPFKDCVYAFIVLGVGVYFYLQKFIQQI